jgi:hypothetical protein
VAGGLIALRVRCVALRPLVRRLAVRWLAIIILAERLLRGDSWILPDCGKSGARRVCQRRPGAEGWYILARLADGRAVTPRR